MNSTSEWKYNNQSITQVCTMQLLQMNSEVTARLKEATQDFKAKLPVVVELANPAMRPRHWQKLFKARVRYI